MKPTHQLLAKIKPLILGRIFPKISMDSHIFLYSFQIPTLISFGHGKDYYSVIFTNHKLLKYRISVKCLFGTKLSVSKPLVVGKLLVDGNLFTVGKH